jgi:hypothetical protein
MTLKQKTILILTSLLSLFSCYVVYIEITEFYKTGVNGKLIEAEVTYKTKNRYTIGIKEKFKSYKIYYQYRIPSNPKFISGNTFVHKDVYDKTQIGSNVLITYNQQNQNQSHLGDIRKINYNNVLAENMFVIAMTGLTIISTIIYFLYCRYHQRIIEILVD